MQTVADFIYESFGMEHHFQIKILSTFVVIAILTLLRIFILKIIFRQTDNIKTRYTWKKTLSYITIVVALIFIGRIWFQAFEKIGTFLGLLSAGIAISLKDLLTNVAAWLFIIVRRPFVLGDRIQVGECAGDVIDIRAYMFTVLEIRSWVDADQSTGRIIHIPNGKVLTNPIVNFTQGFQYLWNEIQINLTYDSDWEKAKELLTEIANEYAGDLTDNVKQKIKEASSKYMIYYNKLTPIVYTKVTEYSVKLTIRYLCPPRARRSTEERFWERILLEFKSQPEIHLAYPTQHFVNKPTVH